MQMTSKSNVEEDCGIFLGFLLQFITKNTVLFY